MYIYWQILFPQLNIISFPWCLLLPFFSVVCMYCSIHIVHLRIYAKMLWCRPVVWTSCTGVSCWPDSSLRDGENRNIWRPSSDCGGGWLTGKLRWPLLTPIMKYALTRRSNIRHTGCWKAGSKHLSLIFCQVKSFEKVLNVMLFHL